jgi:hypothetical protein
MERIPPTFFFSTASGLMMQSVRSTAMKVLLRVGFVLVGGS